MCYNYCMEKNLMTTESRICVRYSCLYNGDVMTDNLAYFADNELQSAIEYADCAKLESESGSIEVCRMEREFIPALYENGVWYAEGWDKWEVVLVEYYIDLE